MMLILHSIERNEQFSSKTKYVMVARIGEKGMEFRVDFNPDVLIGLTLDDEAEASEIYDKIMALVARTRGNLVAAKLTTY